MRRRPARLPGSLTSLLMIAGVSALVLTPRLAFAQDSTPVASSAKAAIANLTFVPAAPVDHADSTSVMEFHRVSPTMQSLYAVTVITQALDAQSTFKALDAGAVESNSLVKPFAGNRPAFVALKVGMATAFIYAGHNLSKTHKIGAVIALGLVNSLYTAIAMNNYHVAHVMNGRR